MVGKDDEHWLGEEMIPGGDYASGATCGHVLEQANEAEF